MANTQRSNKTAAEILATAPVNALDISTCMTFFTNCARWSTIEQYEPIKETAWLGLKEIDRLCRREVCLMNLKAALQAYIDIYSIESITPADLTPSEPPIDEEESSMTISWPVEGQAATTPVLPPREGL